MLGDVSLSTIGLSATLSVATGYLGTLISFDSTTRPIAAAEAVRLAGLMRDGESSAPEPHDDVARHLASIRLARHRSRALVRALRREVPSTASEKLRYAVRTAKIWLRRRRRRVVGYAVEGKRVLSPAR